MLLSPLTMFLLIYCVKTQEVTTIPPTQTPALTTTKPETMESILSGFYDEDIITTTQETNYENVTLTSDLIEFPRKLDLAKNNIKSALKELAKGGPPIPTRYQEKSNFYYYMAIVDEPYDKALRTCKREGAEFYEITKDSEAELTNNLC